MKRGGHPHAMWKVALVLLVLAADARNLRRNATSHLAAGTQVADTIKFDSENKSALAAKKLAVHEMQAPMWDVQVGDLVYDFGFFNGADSRWYLSAGFRVVAVEADPTLVQAAHADVQMKTWLNSGQLQLLNVAIAPDHGTQPWTTFYINKCTREWNSFYSSIGCRACEPPHPEAPQFCTAVPMAAVTCASVLAQHGIPRYFKLDIEGAETGCYTALTTLPEATRPVFISGEVGNAAIIETFKGLGYKSFKLVNQQNGGSGAWGANAVDCRVGKLWRSYLGAQQELTAILNKAPVAGDVCPGSKVGGVWYDLHASMNLPQAW